MLSKTALVVIVLLLVFFSLAAQSQQTKSGQDQANANATNTAPCAFDFSSDANNTSFRFCVTATGNIPEIETPQGRAQVSFDRHEGYGLCNESPAVAYYDYGQFGDSGNWGTATVVSQTAQSVKIARTTADGIWTLTQTFTLIPATPSVKVVMALKNNTAAPRVAYLVRYADIDADWNNTGVVQNNLTATTGGAFAWNASIPFGLNSGFGCAEHRREENEDCDDDLSWYVRLHTTWDKAFARGGPTGLAATNPCSKRHRRLGSLFACH